MDAQLHQSASNILEDVANVTGSYLEMAMFSYFISCVLVTLIPLSALAKLYKTSATKSTQTDAIINTNDQGTEDGEEPQQDTYYGNGEINFEAEKQKSYVKAVLEVFDDVTDQELKHTMEYLQKKRVTMIDAANFIRAVLYLRSHGHNMEDDQATGQGQRREAAREELIRVLIDSGYDDAEDIVGRYERAYPGSLPTKEEFIDFYETLRGIVDLEKKLAKEKVVAEQEKRKAEQEKRNLAEMKDQQIEEEKRKAEQEKRKAEQEKRNLAEMKDQQIEEEKRKAEQEKRKAEQEKRNLAEMKDQQIEEEKRKAEQEKRKAEQEKRKAEMKDQQIEEEKRKAEQEKRKALDLEIQAQRSLCKLCYAEEVGMLCLPCNHLYSCSHCADEVRRHGRCHMCNTPVNTLLPISLS